jgi:hypothetical protein
LFKAGEGAEASRRSYPMAEQRIIIPEQRGGLDKTVVPCKFLDE